jgi:hypothetical protein
MKRIMIVIVCIFLHGCVQYKPIIPSGYTGEIASIEDTLQRKGVGAYVYCVSKIDGNPIPNAITNSLDASAGRGIHLSLVGENRNIPVKPLKITLTARVIHAAPVTSLFDSESNNHLEGEIEFTPIKNMKYFVKGTLQKDATSIWIEDINGVVVSKPLGNPSTSKLTEKTQKRENLTPAEKFSSINIGESVDSVIQKLGNPENVIETKTRSLHGHDITTYEYQNLGKIRFFGIQPNIKTVEMLIPSVEANGSPEELRAKINATPATELRLLAKAYLLNNTPDINYLDVLADKIWTERNNPDKSMEDAMAYLCLTLGKSKNARYRDFLTSVLQQSKSKKLKRYAKKELKLLSKDANAVQFSPTK